MNRNLTREECLLLGIELYNEVAEVAWEKHKSEYNLSGDLSICEHCGRKRSICCICDTAKKEWDKKMVEVHEVQVNRDKKRTTFPRHPIPN